MRSSSLEAARLAALSRSRILESPGDPAFDALAREAARSAGCALAMITFIDADTVWPKATVGFCAGPFPREHSPCARVLQGEPVVIADLTADAELLASALVHAPPHARFYAAVPITGPSGHVIGSLAVLDPTPRAAHGGPGVAIASLAVLADAVSAHVELSYLRDARLPKSEALLSAAQRIAGIGSWEWTIPTGELVWSDEMYPILGLAPGSPPSIEAYLGRVHPDDLALVTARMEAVTSEGLSQFPDYRVRWPDGTVRIVAATAELARDRHGAPLRLIGALQDVTEQRRHEQEREELAMQMLHAQKLESLGVLAAGVAHDFNNFLVGVLGNAELAALDPDLSPHTRTLIEHVVGAARHASGLTRQLLAYTGRGTVAMRPIDLGEHVAGLSSLLRASLPKAVRVDSEIEAGLPAIRADADQLQQVIMNLILNAADAYGGKEGVVYVRTFHDEVSGTRRHALTAPGPLNPGSYVVMEVRDAGAGMEPSTLARIFEPFFTTKVTGRGLGLAAVMGIVRAHGAVLAVDSEPGVGTGFRVYFSTPVRPSVFPPGPPHREPGSATGPSLRGRTALVVDDEPAVRSVVRAMLEREGMHVIEAEDGARALALFESVGGAVDLLVLDRVMPGPEPGTVLARIHSTHPGLPVLIYSGLPDDDPLRAVRAPAARQAFLPKPFSPSALVDKVRQLLAQ